MTAASRQPADGGFTLVELIVCLGILSLMAALMAAGLAVAKGGARLVDAADDLDTMRAVETHLRRTFERVEPLFLQDATGTARLAFTGGADRIRFVARSDGRLESGGLVMVEIAMEPDGDGQALTTRRQPLDGSASNQAAPKARVLLRGVTGLAFRYFGTAAGGSAPSWSETWSGRDAAPKLVEVKISFGLPGRRWPASLFAVPASRGP